MKKIISVFVLCSLWIQLLSPNQVSAKQSTDAFPDSSLHARCAVLMDAENNRILYGKEENLALPMASTTKIMTCIVALEQSADHNLQKELVTVSAYAARMPDVQLNMLEGEQYRLHDLLYSMMLESHNDSAVAIAEHIGGTVEQFADMMNEKAKEIGCENTCFLTPNGLDATITKTLSDGSTQTLVHSSSAADMARILGYCIMRSPKKDEFLEITRCASYSFTNIELGKDGTQTPGARTFTCYNHNAFLNMMEGALTGKTGFTGNAGYCYVGALKRDGKTLVIALLACGWPNNRSWKWQDTKKIFTYGLEHYHKQNIVDESKLHFSKIPVKNAQNEMGLLSAEKTVIPIIQKNEYTMLIADEEQVETEIHLPDFLTAPVETGTQIGNILYSVNQEPVFEIPIYIGETISARDWSWYFELVRNRFFQKCY